MLLRHTTVAIPAEREREADLNEFGTLSTRTCAGFGAAAVEIGSPDYGRNGASVDGVETDATDAIANILHHVARQEGDVERVLRNARMHWEAESAHPAARR